MPLGGTPTHPQIVLQLQADTTKLTSKQRQKAVVTRMSTDIARTLGSGFNAGDKSSQHDRSQSFEAGDDKSRHTRTTTTQGSFNAIDVAIIRMLGQILLLNL